MRDTPVHHPAGVVPHVLRFQGLAAQLVGFKQLLDEGLGAVYAQGAVLGIDGPVAIPRQAVPIEANGARVRELLHTVLS